MPDVTEPPLTASAVNALKATTASATTPGPSPSWGDAVDAWFKGGGLQKTLGSSLGGMLGSSIAESYFPLTKQAASDPGNTGTNAHLTPMSELPPLSHYIGGGSGTSTGSIPFGAPRRPPISYRPGIDPQFGYFSP